MNVGSSRGLLMAVALVATVIFLSVAERISILSVLAILGEIALGIAVAVGVGILIYGFWAMGNQAQIVDKLRPPEDKKE